MRAHASSGIVGPPVEGAHAGLFVRAMSGALSTGPAEGFRGTRAETDGAHASMSAQAR